MNLGGRDELFCNKCGKKTNHEILCSVSKDGADGEVSWSTEYGTLECGGCGEITFRKRYYFSEWDERAVGGKDNVEETLFPPRLFRQRPIWIGDLPEPLRSVLDEVYIALQNHMRSLSTAGIRTVLDAILVDKVGDKGTFADKLKVFEQRSFVDETEYERLTIALETGHAAVHRGFVPDEDDLIVVMDILEPLIEKLYVLDKRNQEMLDKARTLQGKIPPKKKP